MKVKVVYFVWFSGLLFAILAAIVVQGNRILRALPYAPDVQEVRVVNGGDDALPVSIQRQPDAAEIVNGKLYIPQVPASPAPSSTALNADGLTPGEQRVFDNLYGPHPGATKPPDTTGH